MKVSINIFKSVQENASFYYDQAKKARRKIDGAKKAYEETLTKVENFSFKKKSKIVKDSRKKFWFEKFRWFISSKKKIVIGGRDATTNDILVKKYAEKGDLVFHTQLRGSPFVIIKAEGKKVVKEEIEEAAIFCASMSKSWNAKATTAEVYYVKPEQIKKEFGLPKGSFMIHGQRNYSKPIIELGFGLFEGSIPMCGPLSAIKKNCKKILSIKQGKHKKSDVAKKVRYFLQKAELVDVALDEIMQALPPGDCDVKEIY
tara:strand:- start:33494 stop:34267 length:774 start_codon:yes stop_codon:yes gene_type:complete